MLTVCASFQQLEHRLTEAFGTFLSAKRVCFPAPVSAADWRPLSISSTWVGSTDADYWMNLFGEEGETICQQPDYT